MGVIAWLFQAFGIVILFALCISAPDSTPAYIVMLALLLAAIYYQLERIIDKMK